MRHTMRGFSMVEFAVVMVIIGLMVGGVVMGRSMLKTARINGTATQVFSYNVAATTFKDTYDELPGDLDTAVGRLPGCTAANACVNGNADGDIGVVAGAWTTVDASIGSENTQFWKHLAAANLLTTVDVGATAPAWGDTHPTSKFNGGFFVRESNGGGGSLPTGPLYIMRAAIDGTWLEASLAPVMAPHDAARLDRHMDDGMAFTGNLHSISAGHSNGCGDANAGGQGPNGYDEDSTLPSCDVMIKVKLR